MNIYLPPLQHWEITAQPDCPPKLYAKIKKRERELNGIKLPVTKKEYAYIQRVLSPWSITVARSREAS